MKQTSLKLGRRAGLIIASLQPRRLAPLLGECFPFSSRCSLLFAVPNSERTAIQICLVVTHWRVADAQTAAEVVGDLNTPRTLDRCVLPFGAHADLFCYGPAEHQAKMAAFGKGSWPMSDVGYATPR
jgi:hypothetical protein